MYILQISNSQYIAYSILGLFIFCLVLYFIIRGAVKDGTNDLKQQLRLLNNFKLEEMRKKGYNEEELKAIIKKAKS